MHFRLGSAKSIALPLLALLACGAAPDWSKHSISGLHPADHSDPPLAEQEPPTVHPARLALERLAQVVDTDDTWQLATRPRIADFGDYRVLDKETVEERLEGVHVRLLLETAQTRIRQGAEEDAVRQLEEALDQVRFDFSRYMIYQRLGIIAFRNQDYAQAEHRMNQALALQPHNPAAASNLAAAQLSQGQHDQALKTLQRIPIGLIRSKPLLFSVHFNMACLHSMMDQPEQALEHLLRAAQSDPPAAWASLGDPQLDAIRNDLRFRDLQLTLEKMIEDR